MIQLREYKKPIIIILDSDVIFQNIKEKKAGIAW